MLRSVTRRSILRLVGFVVLLFGALSSAASAAPTIAITVAPDPVESIATQLGVTGTNDQQQLRVVLHVKPAGGSSCAANVSADDGREVVARWAKQGPFAETENHTFARAGDYLLCAWAQTDVFSSAPALAAASAVISVRIPKLSLSLSAPPTVRQEQTFQVTVTAQAETERGVYVSSIPDTGRGCPANFAALAAGVGERDVLTSWWVTGGPLTRTENTTLSTPGRYLICGYFQFGDTGSPPEAVASTALTVLAPCVIPSLAGKSRTKAEQALIKANCSLGKVKKDYSSKYAKGKVVRSNQKAGTVLAPSARVGIVVSKGKKKAKKRRR